MQNDRRRFLVAGAAAGLAPLLVPDKLLACCCRPRGHARCRASERVSPYLNCPAGFQWSSMNPKIPDYKNLTQGVPHNITVFGTGLANWIQNVGYPYVGIADENNPFGVIWGSYTNVGWMAGSSGNPDQWTFSAVENGSSPGSSSITITVTLSPLGGCRGTWINQPVTYA
jgi:hypothetical protein